MSSVIALAAGLPSFEEIIELERLMLHSGAVVDIKTTHYFAPGVYAREIFVPAGVAFVGSLHKTEHLSVVSLGRILIASELYTAEFKAPHTFVAPIGMKRCGFALEDTVWTTFHPTNERDLAAIEDHFIAKSREEFLQWVRGGSREELLCRS